MIDGPLPKAFRSVARILYTWRRSICRLSLVELRILEVPGHDKAGFFLKDGQHYQTLGPPANTGPETVASTPAVTALPTPATPAPAPSAPAPVEEHTRAACSVRAGHEDRRAPETTSSRRGAIKVRRLEPPSRARADRMAAAENSLCTASHRRR